MDQINELNELWTVNKFACCKGLSIANGAIQKCMHMTVVSHRRAGGKKKKKHMSAFSCAQTFWASCSSGKDVSLKYFKLHIKVKSLHNLFFFPLWHLVWSALAKKKKKSAICIFSCFVYMFWHFYFEHIIFSVPNVFLFASIPSVCKHTYKSLHVPVLVLFMVEYSKEVWVPLLGSGEKRVVFSWLQ